MGVLRAVEKFPCPPNLHPSLAHLPRSKDRGGHHCGRVTAAQSRSSPELHGTALYSLHIPFTFNPEADTDYSPIFQARKTRLMRESASAKGSVSSGRGGASTQVTTSNVPTLPLRESGQVGSLPGRACLGRGAHSGLEQGAGFLGSQSLKKAAQTSVPLSGM